MPSDTAVADALRSKFAELVERRTDVKRRISELMDVAKEIERDVQDCMAAGRLFKIDLEAEPRERPVVEELAERPLPSPPPQATVDSEPPQSIRDMVTAFLEHAYPQSRRAVELRAALSEKGIDTHYKTVGMTLYRLLQRGIVRREGIQWFFVPETERRNREAADTSPEQASSAAPSPPTQTLFESKAGGI